MNFARFSFASVIFVVLLSACGGTPDSRDPASDSPVRTEVSAADAKYTIIYRPGIPTFRPTIPIYYRPPAQNPVQGPVVVKPTPIPVVSPKPSPIPVISPSPTPKPSPVASPSPTPVSSYSTCVGGQFGSAGQYSTALNYSQYRYGTSYGYPSAGDMPFVNDGGFLTGQQFVNYFSSNYFSGIVPPSAMVARMELVLTNHIVRLYPWHQQTGNFPHYQNLTPVDINPDPFLVSNAVCTGSSDPNCHVYEIPYWRVYPGLSMALGWATRPSTQGDGVFAVLDISTVYRLDSNRMDSTGRYFMNAVFGQHVCRIVLPLIWSLQ